MVRVFKEAGRPLPRFSDDDVIDYLVTEAAVFKAAEVEAAENKKAEKERARSEWKSDREAMKQLAASASVVTP
jgi:hypothetical protein